MILDSKVELDEREKQDPQDMKDQPVVLEMMVILENVG